MARKKTAIRNYKYYRRQITLPNGQRKSLYGKTAEELDEKVAAFKGSMTAKKAVPTVAEYADEQLALMKSSVSPATYVGYEGKIRLYIKGDRKSETAGDHDKKGVLPSLGDKKLDEVTEDDIRRTLQQVSRQSQSSYSKLYMLLQKIFSAARRNHLINDNPTDGIPSKGGIPPKATYALSDDEVACLLSAVEGLPVETFVRFGLYAGLRREEILAMRWDCVHLDVEHPYIQVRRAWRIAHNRPDVSEILKTDAAYRNIPIPPALVEHLRAVQAVSSSDYVICNRDGGPLSGSQWRNFWKKVTVRTVKERKYTRYSKGKKEVHTVKPQLGDHAVHNPHVVYSLSFDLTPHKLRRTYVSNLIYAGLDPKTVQYLAGHKNIKITMDIYAKLKYNRPSDIAPAVCRAFRDVQKEQDLS